MELLCENYQMINDLPYKCAPCDILATSFFYIYYATMVSHFLALLSCTIIRRPLSSLATI